MSTLGFLEDKRRPGPFYIIIRRVTSGSRQDL
jgi:hypothetical protein